jgi:hypothetical protein
MFRLKQLPDRVLQPKMRAICVISALVLVVVGCVAGQILPVLETGATQSPDPVGTNNRLQNAFSSVSSGIDRPRCKLAIVCLVASDTLAPDIGVAAESAWFQRTLRDSASTAGQPRPGNMATSGCWCCSLRTEILLQLLKG